MIVFSCSRKCCPRKRERPESFAPARGAKRMKDYGDALNILNTADTFRTPLELIKAEKVIETLRCKTCNACRQSDKKSKARPESKIAICKAFVQDLKRRHLGKPCACGCGLVFTEENLSILEFDHLDPGTKKHGVCYYPFWACPVNGGKAGMEEEYAKCRAICMACHRISSAAQSAAKAAIRSAAQRAANAAARLLQMLNKGGYATKRKESQAKRYRQYMDEKLAFVNKKKRDTKRCECDDPTCDRVVTPGNCCAFDFAHRPGAGGDGAKLYCISVLVTNRLSPKTAIPLIEAETSKCRLMHCHCHKIQETDTGRDAVKLLTFQLKYL